MLRVFTGFALTLFLILNSFSLSFSDELDYQPSGPFNIRNQMPVYLYYIMPRPEEARVLETGKFKADFSYHVSNIIIQQRPWPAEHFTPSDNCGDGQRNREWYTYIDTEVNRFDLSLNYGLRDNLGIGVDIPYFVFADGYLDGFIEAFEDSFSFIRTPGAREEREKYTYQYEVRNRAKPVILSTAHPNGLGEVSGYLKYNCLNEETYLPAVSIRSGIKFPTSADEFLGSKKYDFAIGILLDKSFFERFFMYFNLNWVFVSRPNIMDNLDVFKHHMIHGIFGFEYCFNPKTSVLFQATANTSLYDEGVTSMGRDPVVLSLGFNHHFTDKVCWQFAVDENTNTGAPDFGVYSGIKLKL